MQKKDSTPFQLNSQVVVMLGITMIALTLPILTVVLALRLPGRQVDKPAVSTAPMQNSLETVATRQLSAPTLSAADRSVELHAVDFAAEAARLDSLARSFGGFTMADAALPDHQRILASVPGPRVDDYLQAARNDTPLRNVDHSSPTPTGGGDQASQLIEIIVRHP